MAFGDEASGLPPPAADVWRWRFGEFELDESKLELRVEGRVVALEPKPLEFLMCLLRHCGEVVTKEELLEALWTGRVVTESVLTSCVAKLRAALDDEAHRIVRTVHGYGYRLVASVHRESLAGPRAFDAPQLHAGDAPATRPLWRLVRPLGRSSGENWLVEHTKTGEKRVFKFAFERWQLAQLRREITVHRMLVSVLGPRDDFVHLLDWNLESPPCFIELDYATGGDLAEWLADQNAGDAPSLGTRLELVAQAAEALAAAHSAGVLHKDLKPANLLVQPRDDGTPSLRMADFGSGGLLDASRLQAFNITAMGFTQQADEVASEGLGTWTYMAPEVVAGQPPTVRSDVFSLGVVLYQMTLSDLQRPLAPGWERDVADELLRDDIRACCDIDPSRRLGDAGELARRLRSLDARRGELERVRAADRRAAELARAVEQARLRRRWLAALAAVGGLAFVVTLLLAVQARRARDDAELQAAAARSVNDYLVRDLIAAANPMQPRPLDAAASSAPRAPDQVPVRELLDRAAQHASQRFEGQPALEAAVRMSLGDAYAGVSNWRAAAREYGLAAGLAARVDTGDPLLKARALQAEGSAWREADDYAAAKARLDQADALLGVRAGRDEVELQRLRIKVRQSRAWLLYKEGAYEQALALMRETRPALERSFGAESDTAAVAAIQQASTELMAGQVREAGATARQALKLRLKLHGTAHPLVIEARATLADALRLAGRHEEALAEAQQALDQSRRLLGPDHFNTLVAQSSVATLLQDLKRYDEAIALFEDAAARSAATTGELGYETGTLFNNLGLAYADAGRPQQAVVALERALRSAYDLLGRDHPQVITSEHNLADVLADAGRWDEADALESAVLPRALKAFGPDHIYLGSIRRTLGRLLAHQGRVDEARASLEEARRILKAELGEAHPQVQKVDGLLQQLPPGP